MTEPEPPGEYLDDAEVGILLAGLADPSVEVRVAMFEALSRLPLSATAWRTVGEYAARVLTSGDSLSERLAVIDAAPAVPLRSVRQRVMRLTRSDDPAVRSHAVDSANEMSKPRTVTEYAVRAGTPLRPGWSGGRNPGFSPRPASLPDTTELPDLDRWTTLRDVESNPVTVTLLMAKAARSGDNTWLGLARANHAWHNIGESNKIVGLVEMAQGKYRPDIEGLFGVYRDVTIRQWEKWRRSGVTEETTIRFGQEDDEGGPRSFCFQIGWLVSRGGLPGLVDELAAHLRDAEERIVAAYLIADAAAYVTQVTAPMFGGGSGPYRPTVSATVPETPVTPPRDPGNPPGEGQERGSPRPRHLQAQMPEQVEAGRPLSLRVAITLSPAGAGSAGLKNFLVPPEGAIVTVLVSAPGLVPDGDMQQDIVVPAGTDSEPHRFAFTAGPVGLHTVTVEAFRGGTFLGAVQLEVSVEHSAAKPSKGKVRTAELPSLFAELGEVTLQVRRDSRDGLYRFQLLGDPMHGEVEGGVMGKANAAVEALVAELNKMAANKSRYANPDLVRRRLKNLGIDLWSSALPQQVREQFWEQADRIKMFTIVTDHDIVPWELLYPADGTNDNGFLAEQFPVVRRFYATKRVTSLPISTAAYVVPPDSPTNARDEIDAIRALLGKRIGDRGVLSELADVSDLMLDPAVPGIMHFACHNTFSAEAGSSIALGGGPFTPVDLASAVAKTSLASGRPLVFLNACRSAAEIPWFASMSGWATRFVQAGAGAFIGSLWAVRSSAARTFAEAFYEQFVAQKQPLGTSSLLARKAVSEDGGDPTWLAYSVYGKPAALVEETADP